MEKTNFYCQKKCGGNEYRTHHINEVISDAKGMNFTDDEIKKVINGTKESFKQKCQTQCNYCAKVVSDTQIKNRKIREERAW